jgi:uncharacterized metal-binding protein
MFMQRMKSCFNTYGKCWSKNMEVGSIFIVFTLSFQFLLTSFVIAMLIHKIGDLAISSF